MSITLAPRLTVALPQAAAMARTRPAPALRPARACDAPAMQAFIDGLGVHSRRSRFHGGLGRCSARLAATLVAADGHRQVVWLATVRAGGPECIVGEARYVRDADAAGTAELAIAVADDWQGRGVADALLRRLLASARAAGVRHLRADVMAANVRMQAFVRRHGFAPGWHDAAEGLCFERDLRSPVLRAWQRLCMLPGALAGVAALGR